MAQARGRGIRGGGKTPSDNGRMMGNSYHPHTPLGMADDESTSARLDWVGQLEELQADLEVVLEAAADFGIDTTRCHLDALAQLAEDDNYEHQAARLRGLLAHREKLSRRAREAMQEDIDKAAARFARRLQSAEDQVALAKVERAIARRRIGAVKAKLTRERKLAEAARRAKRMDDARREERVTEEGARWFLATFTHEDWGRRLMNLRRTDLVLDSILLPGRYAYIKVPVTELSKEDVDKGRAHGWQIGRDCWGRHFLVPQDTRELLREVVSWKIQWSSPLPKTEVVKAAACSDRFSRWLPHLHAWLTDPPADAPALTE